MTASASMPAEPQCEIGIWVELPPAITTPAEDRGGHQFAKEHGTGNHGLRPAERRGCCARHLRRTAARRPAGEAVDEPAGMVARSGEVAARRVSSVPTHPPPPGR